MTENHSELSKMHECLIQAFCDYHLPDSELIDDSEETISAGAAAFDMLELVGRVPKDQDFVFITLGNKICLNHVKIRQNKLRTETIPLEVEVLPGNKSKLNEVGLDFYKVPKGKRFKIFHRDAQSEVKWKDYSSEIVSYENQLDDLLENSDMFSAVIKMLKKAVRHIINGSDTVSAIVFVEDGIKLANDLQALTKENLGFSNLVISSVNGGEFNNHLWCVFREMEDFVYYEGRPVLNANHESGEESLWRFSQGSFSQQPEFSISDCEEELFAVLHSNLSEEIKLPVGHYLLNEEMMTKARCVEHIFKVSFPDLFIKEFVEKRELLIADIRKLTNKLENKKSTRHKAGQLLDKLQTLEVVLS